MYSHRLDNTEAVVLSSDFFWVSIETGKQTNKQASTQANINAVGDLFSTIRGMEACSDLMKQSLI